MSKERQITITGDARRNIIISGDSNVVLFSNSTAPLAEKAASSANPYIGIESFTEKEADRFFWSGCADQKNILRLFRSIRRRSG